MPSVADQLLDRTGVLPESGGKRPGWQRVLRVILPLVFLIVLIVPGYTYFVTDRAASALFGSDITPAVRFYTLFRLFGLYAFTFVWGQLMFGPFMQPLGKLFGRNWFFFHRAQGLFALLLATLHPLIFYLAFYLDTGSFDFAHGISHYTPSLAGYLGPVAWTLMATTVGTAMLMRKPWLQRRWRWIHLLNYLVFLTAFIHSISIGSDTHAEPLLTLYWFFGVSFVAAVIYRRVYRPATGTDTLPKWR